MFLLGANRKVNVDWTSPLTHAHGDRDRDRDTETHRERYTPPPPLPQFKVPSLQPCAYLAVALLLLLLLLLLHLFLVVKHLVGATALLNKLVACKHNVA